MRLTTAASSRSASAKVDLDEGIKELVKILSVTTIANPLRNA